MSNKNLGSRFVTVLVSTLVTALIGWGIYYLTLPAMTFHSSGFWWYWLVVGIIGAIAYFVANSIICKNGGRIPGFVLGGAAIAWLIIFAITGIAGSQMVNAIRYSEVIDVETGNFSEDIDQVDVNNLVVVDVKTAQKLGDRKIGNIDNASWYEVDSEYNLVVINGEAYRISPLKYGGFLKYLKGKSFGIPGYVLVNAKNQNAEYVELENAIKYSPSACFRYDLGRHLRNQFPSYIFGKAFFEVDDSGNPFWITSVKTPQIGMRGALETTAVVVTDAITGKSDVFDLSNIPEWIDHVDSVSHLMQLIDWHYTYWDGFLNAFGSKTKINKTSYFYKDKEQTASQDENKNDLAANEHTPFDGYNSIVTDDGKVMFYTGLTPENNAESNKGFLLIDPRTHEVTYYEAEGAEESSVQGAAEGLVSNLRYSASFPTIVNVDGVETYFMVLKDAAGLIQRYAFANVEDYTKCVQADTKEDALKLYKIKIGLLEDDSDTNDQNQQTNKPENVPEVETTELTGKVVQIQEAQIEGFTYYYFILEGNEMIFMSSIENSNLQPMKLQIGNSVTINYYASTAEEGIGIVTAIKFE